MSLMKSLARVAAGVMLAKGVGTMMQNRQQSSTTPQQGGGLLNDLLRNNTGGAGGSVTDMLGRALGGGAGTGRRYGGANSAGAQGGLGGLLDQLGGRGGAGLGDVLGGLLGGAAGGLAQKDSQARNDATFGELFNDAVSHTGEPEVAPTAEQNALAGLMLRAMIQAAKADGKIDERERAHLMGQLGDDLDDDERQFIREQMAAPVDAQALANDVPKGLESQVYLMSLLAISFDNEAEARYLNDLATAMGLSRSAVNAIHDEAGVAPLYNRS
ncbi:DUF533 domain-containing protein [Paracoccus sp. (in: a-proteobacteria)]|uniref:DUF533 domain-containing protein n=1 Tax=Paracoccus sp. TaxID=267 RepID=UPI0026DF709D|nr:DUF533 domain-containing protein [Paracoccus sp. (in: a-proteobacteria)]MDO5648466.1 DUF533 domain-containing protein [Paracoccus sp. (in: a-proteobacteria)]